ncbi:MAG: hemerythrin [Planctomycetota bacterium]|nr:MAG: hemerythrin [Planctomycetota bacterium]
MPDPRQPTSELVAEHDNILTLLGVVERLAELAEEPTPPLDDMAAAIDLIRRYADALHHGKEEQLLFPRLEEAGLPPGGGPVACMRHEHEEGRGYVAAMDDALSELRAGTEGAGASFARAALAYVHLLRAHIEKENCVLFPLAEEMLSAETKEELCARFADVEEHDVGREAVKELLATLHRLAEAHALGAR